MKEPSPRTAAGTKDSTNRRRACPSRTMCSKISTRNRICRKEMAITETGPVARGVSQERDLFGSCNTAPIIVSREASPRRMAFSSSSR